MKIRHIAEEDVEEISAFLNQLADLGKRKSRSDADFVRDTYLNSSDLIQCAVAEADGHRVLGFQVLKRMGPDNIYDVPPGWGIIGTHIRPDAARQGVGRRLFEVTYKAALAAGLRDIDATIGAENAEGLAYYNAMGFVTYRKLEGAVGKRLKL